MEKYEVAIPDEVQQMLNDLSGEWVNFQQTLIDADAMLKKNKASPILLPKPMCLQPDFVAYSTAQHFITKATSFTAMKNKAVI